MIKRGVVIKSVGGVFTVMDENSKKTVCYSPKKFRYNENDVIIGDNVDFEELKSGKGVIDKIYPRRNKLSRPEIANVDVCFLVLASEPQPDFLLADKVLINCFQEHIEPVIVVNKIDLSNDVARKAELNYGSVADIVCVSAANGSVDALKPFVRGKLACFAGQSAVGKTSLLNALLPESCGAVGGLSLKSGRGTHTTRHAVLHRAFGGFVADTCGFSLCDLSGIRSDELRLYLDDFVEISRECRYPSCTHTAEPDCAVKRAVLEGKLYADRYERYLAEYGELKEFEKNRF